MPRRYAFISKQARMYSVVSASVQHLRRVVDNEKRVTNEWKGGFTIDDCPTFVMWMTQYLWSQILKMETVSKEAGLMLIRAKCYLMVADSRKILPQPFQTRWQHIGKGKSDTSRGTLLTNKSRCDEEEIKRRITTAKTAWSRLAKIWKDHHRIIPGKRKGT